jgi:hypothetical protein
MNVVSSYSPNTLPVVFDRGLIGTFHDWYVWNFKLINHKVTCLWMFLSCIILSYGLFGNDMNFMTCAIRCEAFSTYPRTYDLLHADGLFTAESHRWICIQSKLWFLTAW